MRAATIGAAALVLLQFIRPTIPAGPATAEVQTTSEVKRILEKDCYSCHSNQRRLAWFDQAVPAYWLVRHDILTARRHLNFSTIGAAPAAAQKAALYESVNMIQLGAMPLPDFVALHPDARVTPEELATLKSWLAPWSSPLLSGNAAPESKGPFVHIPYEAVPSEGNGLPFDPAFASWKLISTTDRGDNNTLRFILGNDIAIDAARAGNISPWPDGTRFAKIAWQQVLGTDGLVYPGGFVQMELMVKDAQRFRSTDGWGWGRWRGVSLKPYGADAAFVGECTSCHLPVRGNDYVYTLPISSARLQHTELVNNNAAGLPAALPYQPLTWNAITMFVDRNNRTTAVLFGNNAAISAVHALDSSVGADLPAYPAGAVIALVIWAQRDDPHWFGARIPDRPLSVEFVEVESSAQSSRYLSFRGAGLEQVRSTPEYAAERMHFILGLPPARLP